MDWKVSRCEVCGQTRILHQLYVNLAGHVIKAWVCQWCEIAYKVKK